MLCKTTGVILTEGTAAFVDEETARIAHSGEDRGNEPIEFKYAVIATGSLIGRLPGFDFAENPIWFSWDVLAAELVAVGWSR